MTITIPNEVYDQYHQTIDRSMAFLDEYLGTREWVNEIDLDAFDLEVSTECVCGQLFDLESGYRTVEDMSEHDGYAYALKYIVEHGVPDDVNSERKAAVYLGFNLDEDPIDEMIAKANGYPNFDTMLRDVNIIDEDIPSAWEMLTETWRERIEKRRAELGTMA